MQTRRSIPHAAHRIATCQGGVILREQAMITEGLTPSVIRRLVLAGHWQRLSPGVFLTTAGEPTWTALAWAGVLIGGSDARLGPAASVHLAGLATAPAPIPVLVPASTLRRRPGPWRFLRERPGVHSTRSVGSPPRLPLEDAIIELAVEFADGATVTLVTDALRLRVTTPHRLLRVLERRARHPRRALLRALLVDVDGIESHLEWEHLRLVERPHGLPRGARQSIDPRFPFHRDVDYQGYALLVELDGRRGHEGEGAFRDMRRDNRHVLAGHRTLRFGWRQVATEPCVVAMQIYLALSQAGYAEPFRHCPRCRQVPDSELRRLSAW